MVRDMTPDPVMSELDPILPDVCRAHKCKVTATLIDDLGHTDWEITHIAAHWSHGMSKLTGTTGAQLYNYFHRNELKYRIQNWLESVHYLRF